MVCYEREEDARRAVEELDGRDFNGRDVKLVFKVDFWDVELLFQ